MNNLTKANEVRAQKSLDVKLRYDGVVMTRRNFLIMQKQNGSSAKAELDHPFMFDRIKFNRMRSNEECRVYEEKYETLVTKYRLYVPDGHYFEITKTEFNYFNSL